MKRATDSSAVDRRERRLALEKKHGVCARCPPHRGENQGRRPRTDAYKSARKGR